MPPPIQTLTANPTLVDGKVAWDLCHTNPDPDNCIESGQFPYVVLGANQGPYRFEIKIVDDDTGLGIKFANIDPIVVKKGELTGPQKQIVGENLQDSDRTLKFMDNNGFPNPGQPNPVVLEYGLNFTDQNGNAVTPIDPIIINGGSIAAPPSPGGPGLMPGSAEFWLLIGAVFLASILGAIIGQFVKGRG